MLGVTRTRANQLALTKGFPEPAHVLAMGRIYRTREVVKWAESVGRKVTPPEEALVARLGTDAERFK